MWQCFSVWCEADCLRHLVWAWHPPVGVWIGLLGLLGVIVPLVRDPKEISRREKAVWTLLLFALLFLEMKSVYQDRNEHDQAERESRERSEQNFREMANGLKGTLNGLDTTIKEGREHFDKTMRGIAGTIGTQTGGDSFAYLTVVPQQQFLAFPHHGKYPLYNVLARIADLDQLKAHPTSSLGTIVAIGDMIKGYGYNMPIPPGMDIPPDHFSANVFFSARNGAWTELLRVQKTQDGWARAIRVIGDFTSLNQWKAVCETIDRDFTLDSSRRVEENWTPDPKLPSCQ